MHLCSLEGRVLALHPDGTPYWNHQLPDGQQVFTAPAIGSNGYVFVVGAEVSGSSTEGAVKTVDAKLYVFGPTGAVAANGVEFPTTHGTASHAGVPAVWEYGPFDQVVMIPVLFRQLGGAELRLLAYGPNGALLHDALVSTWMSGPVMGSGLDELLEVLGSEFDPGVYAHPPLPPCPAAAIRPHPQGGTPFIVVCDRPNSHVVSLTYCLGSNCSPAAGFTERVRTEHAPRTLWSAPEFLLDMHAIVGTDQGVVFSGPTQTAVPPPPSGIRHVFATPTRAVGARIVIVDHLAQVVALHQNGTVSTRVTLSGLSVASAASSRTHVFVATSDGLYTLDAAASTTLAKFPWVGGGLWSPAVGPEGHVYAMASNILFVFPPPRDTGSDGKMAPDNPTIGSERER